MLSLLGKKYEPLIFKVEVTGFHYFDINHNKFVTVPSNELEFGENKFTVKFPEYELGFQRIVYVGSYNCAFIMIKKFIINIVIFGHCDSWFSISNKNYSLKT